MRDTTASPLPDGPIAVVTGRYPAPSLTFIDREVRALRKAGCDVVTVTIRSPDHGSLRGSFQSEEAGKVHCVIASARTPLSVFRSLAAALSRPARLRAMLSLALMARPAGPIGVHLRHAAYVIEALLLADFLRRKGVVHAHNHLGDSSGTVTMLAAELAGLPFSMTLHGPEVFEAAEVWRLDAKIAKASTTVCISTDGRDKALRHCSAGDRDKVVTIPCGVTVAQYDAVGPRTGRKLLFVGRLVPRKGADVLIDALAIASNRGFAVELDIVGEGPEQARLHALVADRGLRDCVAFRGALCEADVARAMGGADVLVVPSLSEGLPVVIMEAMASGVPVVASKIDGIPELVHDGETGLLVPPCDPKALAHALVRLLADPGMARRMGAGGRVIVVERHDAERNALTLLRTILSGPAAHKGQGDRVNSRVSSQSVAEGKHHERHAN